jgi:hypothetical protein
VSRLPEQRLEQPSHQRERLSCQRELLREWWWYPLVQPQEL